MGQQKVILLVLAILAKASIWAQLEAPSYNDKVFDPDIKSVRMHVGERALGMPIINWDGNTYVTLKFDDLMEDPRNLFYKIIHCDADWTPSELRVEEYLDGFEEEELRNYEYSALTWTPYIHYSLQIPNPQTRLLQPGNYVIYVYEDDDTQPILTRRFVFMDTRIGILAELRRAIGGAKVNTHQAIEFTAVHKNFRIDDPSSDVTAYVLQNENWNSMIEVPMRSFRNDQILYDYPGSIAFPGGKEHRQIDLRSLDFELQGVKFIEKDELGYRFFAHPNVDLRNDVYKNYLDLNGAFVIDNYDNRGAFQPNFSALSANQLVETRSDYVRAVISFLSDPLDTDVYVTGKLSQWNLEEEYRMQYNEEYGAYMVELWLKQGFYDYSIVAKDHSQDPPALINMSGNWYETENDYLILMYHRGFNDRFDRPIGSFVLEN